MAVYRTGYGVGNYSVRTFGLDGAITDAISLVETAAVTLAGGEVVKTSSASSVASSSLTSSGEFVVDAIASTASTSSTSSSGEVIYLGSATSSAGIASASASLQFLTNADAHSTVAATSTADCIRVRLATQVVDANASVSCGGFITARGGATIDANSDTSSACVRVRKSPATIAGAADFTASGRYKYEQMAKDNETWAVVPQGNEIWTEVA